MAALLACSLRKLRHPPVFLSCYPQPMSNSDLLGKADKPLRPVVKEISRFPWIRLEGCCAGHKQEDSLWLEINVLGTSGLKRLTDMLRILDGKLAGTDCRVDCLLSYSGGPDNSSVPHGWIPAAVEIFWPARSDWKRSQSMVIETLLSAIEESSNRLTENSETPCAINYCPFCSSSFIRMDNIDKSGNHQYRCGDCDMVWTMVDPVV
jgi:hypothetical protein